MRGAGKLLIVTEHDMPQFNQNIRELAKDNTDFRREILTNEHSQVVLMSIEPGDEIGEETHDDRDQFFRIEEGRGEIVIDGRRHQVEDDYAVIVPAGALHNVINSGSAPLKLYTLYGPPEHRDSVVHRTRSDAVTDHEHFDGTTTE